MLPQVFGPQEVKEARDLIMEHSSDANKETHFHGAHEDKISLQRRVWNLLNKGDIFVQMVENRELNSIVSEFLGKDFHIHKKKQIKRTMV